MTKLKPAQTDMVNKPPHYQPVDDGEIQIECLDAMIAAFGRQRVEDYCQIAAFKYQWRAGRKGDWSKEDEDKEKAIFYLRFSLGDDPRRDTD